ncbi:MAG: polysaccharide pyruvyl transferase CsaB [Candidatus Caldatribacteriota bacterium]|nr:polysaccharide pyruvyl transferase CsaB [Candidatus Caldatribacteriota bacterium]
MKKSKTILQMMISGYYGFKNTGDEAILSSMVKNIRVKIPQAEITVLTKNPLETSHDYQVKTINRMQWLQILKCFAHTDIFISGGGGLLQDSTGRGWSILYYLGLILMAKIYRIPVMFYAQGIGPVKRQFNKILIKWVLNQVDLITVRDRQSKELLKKLEVKNPLVHVNADPSFLLEKKNIDTLLEKIPHLKEFIYGNNQQLVGISVRSYKGNSENLRKKIALIADNLIQEYEAKIIFIPFKAEEDISLSIKIMEIMENSKQVYILEEQFEPEILLTLISRLSFMLGVRLHSIMFSCLVQIPFLAFNYDPKVKNFVYNLDLPELLLDLDDLSLKAIKKKVEYVRENNDKIIKILSKKVKVLKEKANCNNDLLFQLLESKQGGSLTLDD